MAPGAPRYLSGVPGAIVRFINNPPRRVTLHAVVNLQAILLRVITKVTYSVHAASVGCATPSRLTIDVCSEGLERVYESKPVIGRSPLTFSALHRPRRSLIAGMYD